MEAPKQFFFPIAGNDNVKTKHDFVDQNAPPPSTTYYFTIPMEKLKTSPNMFADVKNDNRFLAFTTILTTIFKLVEEMFYVSPHRKYFGTCYEHERVQVFMEYITSGEVFSYTDLVYIRFHIVIFDDTCDFMQGLSKLICDNGGEIESYDDGNEPPAKKKKKAPKKNANRKKLPYESFTTINSFVAYYIACCHITGDNGKHYLDGIVDDVSFIPTIDNDYHPTNMFSWEKSVFDDMHPSQKINGVAFSDRSLVFRVPPSICTPYGIMVAILPYSIKWKNEGKEEQLSTLSNFEVEDMARNFFLNENIVPDSDIKSLQENNKNDVVDQHNIHKMCGLWNTHVDVSNSHLIFVQRAYEQKSWSKHLLPKVDNELSFTGNLVSSIMLGFEKIIGLNYTHLHLFKIFIYSLDAFRYAFDLHNNVLLLGAASAGKSYLLQSVGKLYERGVVNSIAHLTDKSISVDTNNNDHITVMEEIPAIMSGISKNNGQESTGDELMKNALTTCVVETNSIVVDNGRRYNAKYRSERIGVYLMATNERYDKIPEPMAQRMIPIVINKGERVNTFVTTPKGVAFSEKNKENFFGFFRNATVVHHMVEKAILLKALPEPDIEVFKVMHKVIVRYLKKTGVIYTDDSFNARALTFLYNAARSFTIFHAVAKFISDKTSPGFGDNDFHNPSCVKKLLGIVPYLFCTEEMALFLLTLFTDKIVKVNNLDVVNTMLNVKQDIWSKSVTETTHGKLNVFNGYVKTIKYFGNYAELYSFFFNNQPGSISRENIIVALREMRIQKYNGKQSKLSLTTCNTK